MPIRPKFVVAAALALGATPALAQPFAIDWYTIDGGGGTVSGGGFTLSGTIGQPDAGAPLTGGNFTLQGGFWALPTAGGPCSIADLAAPFGQLTFADISTFLAAFSTSNPAADLAAPFGSFTFADIAAFLAAFAAGCP